MVFKATKQTRNGIPTVVFPTKTRLVEFLKEYEDGEELVIEISTKRTLPQNRTYHMWIRQVADFIGESPEAVKAWITCKIWGCEDVEFEGVTYTVPVSTASLNKEEFANGLTRFQIWAKENLNLNLNSEYLHYD